MKTSFCLLATVAAIACGHAHAAASPTASADAATSPTVEFRFQPVDGTRVVSVYRQQQRRETPGQPTVDAETTQQVESTIRRVDDHYEIAERILSVSAQRNGAPVDNPVLNLLAKVPYTAIVSAEGEMVEIQGMGEVSRLATTSLPPAMAAALAPVLNEATLTNLAKAEWNGRIAEFHGLSVQIGDVLDGEAEQALPTGGSLRYTIRTRFPRFEPCGPRQCVRVEQVYESDAAALAAMADEMTQRLASAAAGSAPAGTAAPAVSTPAPGAARVSGTLTRLVDAETLQIYQERLDRTIVLPLNVPGHGQVTTTQREQRSYDMTVTLP